MYPYAPPVRDIQFVLHEVLGLSASGLPGHAEMTPDLTEQVLEEAGRLSRDVLAPLNAVGDRQGCRLENGVVVTPDGFRDAYRQICAGGWTALDCPAEYGGQGLPYALHTATGEMFVAANMAFNMYQGLTHGAVSALHSHGTAEQKATFLPRLISGEWTGTMNLTEAEAGTDLGLMRTRAEPQADGTFRITGEKIFISAGDHDLSRNVIHLVLAKAPGGDQGTKGVSLFLVPKFMIAADGTLGARNGLSVTRLERKMGIHGNATCAMRYEGATGWLVGELHKGMRPMFTMMNEARLGVALQGYACAAAAHGQAAAYACERIQGRDIDSPAPVPIVTHPDIRRSLMDQRSFVEGARAFTLWGAHLIDRARGGDAAAEALISLLTPVLKGFLTDKGFEMAVAAQQVFGGHGYIEDSGMSQYVRDARIAMIYEGANGIQALDLVGRKLGQDGGRAMMAFLELVNGFLRDNAGDAGLKADFLDPLAAAVRDLQAAAMYFLQRAPIAPRDPLAGATDFLHLFGHVAMGYIWARMAQAALGRDDRFHAAKCATGRYYMARQLPATALHLLRITSGAGPVMALDADDFGHGN